MASSTATTGRNEMRINLLRGFHSKLYATELEAYYDLYHIPHMFTLSSLERAQAVYDHSRVVAPVYLHHLEYGLRLPLYSFLTRVFDALGVSPSKIKLNSIATMVGFVVICHWFGVNPTLRMLGHLISVKTGKMEGHYYFQNLSDFKVVSNAPELSKDGKETILNLLLQEEESGGLK